MQRAHAGARMASTSPVCVNASFATVVSGSKYAAAAACLPRQLQQVKSVCPRMLLVYDDRDTELPMALLTWAYGADRMLPLTELQARYQAGRAASTGRRLYASSEVSRLFVKLWIWALPLQRVVFLDADVVLVRNVDELLRVNARLAADYCVHCTGTFYNTGVMVLAPDLRRLRSLLSMARFVASPWKSFFPQSVGERYVDVCSPRDDPHRYRRLFPNASNPFQTCRSFHGAKRLRYIPKACEDKHGDQSIINQVFGVRGSTRLSPGYNDVMFQGFNATTTRILHFSAEPKPWAETASKFAINMCRARHCASESTTPRYRRCIAALRSSKSDPAHRNAAVQSTVADSCLQAVALYRDRCRATFARQARLSGANVTSWATPAA